MPDASLSQGGELPRVRSGRRQVISPVTGRTYDLMFVVENGKEIVIVTDAPEAK